MIKIRGRYIADPEAYALRYELSLGSAPRIIKKALQRLCSHYEAGKKLRDTSEHRQLIHSHLWSNDVLLRRWSMKALGLISHRDDTARLLDRLKVEDDFEAQTWGTAALIATIGDRSMADLCIQAGIEKSTPFWLAARLYAPHRWLNKNWQTTTVSLHDDEITLKWAIFLAGYDKAPDDLFDPKYDNRIFLGELNQHASPMLSEYSIWALWERPDYGFGDLRIKPDKFLDHPENARKWLYRLLLQSPMLGGQDPGIIEEYRLKEASPSAREGLAAGLAERLNPPLHTIALDWYDDEEDASVKDILLSSMASKSDDNGDFASIVQQRFLDAGPGGYLRKRLLAASEGTGLYKGLKLLELREQITHSDLLGFEPVTNMFIQGSYKQMGNTFNAGRDINAQNLAGGDIVSDAVSAVQNLPQSADQAVLDRVLKFASSAEIPTDQRENIAKSVELAATKPGPESRKGVLTTLKSIGSIVGTVAGLTEISEAVQEWLS